jgi:hypothetical protein
MEANGDKKRAVTGSLYRAGWGMRAKAVGFLFSTPRISIPLSRVSERPLCSPTWGCFGDGQRWLGFERATSGDICGTARPPSPFAGDRWLGIWSKYYYRGAIPPIVHALRPRMLPLSDPRWLPVHLERSSPDVFELQRGLINLLQSNYS